MTFDEPPEKIWLQYYGDGEPENVPVDADGVSWCWEQIFPQDIQYVRDDLARENHAELIAAVRAVVSWDWPLIYAGMEYGGAGEPEGLPDLMRLDRVCKKISAEHE